MTGFQNQRIVLACRPDGDLRPTDFRLEAVETPVPGDREVLLETIFLSIDPYMRFWMRLEKSYYDPIKIGQLMVGATVSRVRQSRHPDWREGDWALGFSGWRRFAVSDGSGLRRIDPDVAPPSTALGVLGMTGFTAYAGLRNIGKPQPGETVVVAAASVAMVAEGIGVALSPFAPPLPPGVRVVSLGPDPACRELGVAVSVAAGEPAPVSALVDMMVGAAS